MRSTVVAILIVKDGQFMLKLHILKLKNVRSNFSKCNNVMTLIYKGLKVIQQTLVFKCLHQDVQIYFKFL